MSSKVVAYFEALAQTKSSTWVRTSQVLLTFNGPWGVLDFSAVGQEWLPVDDMCEMLRQNERCLELKASVEEAVASWASKFFCAETSWSLELCTETYEQARARAQGTYAFCVRAPPCTAL
jgi:hypothetical protein